MAKRTGLRDNAIATLERNHTLTQNDIGPDACLKSKGTTLETESWEIQDVGHLCILQMKALFGLMRMETVVIAPTGVDAPLFNQDWVMAFGTETQIVELYNTQLQPWPEQSQEAFESVREKYADLPDAQSKDAHWYDKILYPCSLHKRGRKLTEPLSRATQEYLETYAGQLASLPPCDTHEKAAKVRAFAERLFDEGGPAVDYITKFFGAQTARRLIVQHMYGVK